MATFFRRKVVPAYLLSILVVLIMSITAFAGAVQSDSGGAVGGPAAPEEPGAEPGQVDNGVIANDIEVDGLDSETQERLAKRILDTEEEIDMKAEPSDVGDLPDLMTSPNSLRTFDDLIASTLNSYMDQVVSGSDTSGDSYSTNLYDTVSDYLNGERTKTFVGYPTQFAEEGYTPDREEVSERTLTSKTFLNEDGTSTAILSQDALHYLDANGEYQDLDLNIRTSAKGGYENVKNNLKSYFAEDNSVVAVDIDGNSRFTWTPVEQVYVDKYDLAHRISSASASEGVIDGNTITYEGTFADTTEEYIVKSDHLKHNLYLSAFPESAVNGKYLSYVGKVDIASGLTLFADGKPVTSDLETAGAIDVVDASGKVVYMLPPPFAVEAENLEENVGGTYSIEVVDGEVFLSMNTPVSWLADSERTYPVVIDPVLYIQINNQMCGYTYHYYYNYTYYSGGSTIYDYYYNYYPNYYAHYYTYMGAYGYYYDYYPNYVYTYDVTYRAWFEWNTSAIPDTDNVKQIDFHGKNWRTYNIYDTSGYDMLVTIRELKLDPEDYPYDSSVAGMAKNKLFFEELVNGSVYNSSVDFGIGYYLSVDVYALGGLAVTHMQNQLSSDVFRMAMHRSVELGQTYPGYGYFETYEYYDSTGKNAYLYVTYDPCPTAPRVDTGGPYSIPEGTTGLTLDASGTMVCGSSVLYMWDTDEDGIYDKTSSSPTIYWNQAFPDDETRTLKLKVMDLSLNLNSEATTTLEVWNVHPRIVTPATTISGYEGTTITFPAIEFTDPGTLDTHTYEYDFDGDDVVDASGSTTSSGGKLYVPSVSAYFCDNADSIDLTVWDSDGGFSDSIAIETVDATYDGYITQYKREEQPITYAYGYITEYNYYTMYLYRYSSLFYDDSEERPTMKFNAKTLPSTFTPTNVTLTSYLAYWYNYEGEDYIKMGVNDLTTDIMPSTGTPNWITVFQDADDSNILDNEEYKTITEDDVGTYVTVYLDPDDFNNRPYTNWYGVAFDFYDPQISGTYSYQYCYFYGGSYTTLEVTDGTSTYKLQCYTNSNTGDAAHGDVYAYWYPARDVTMRIDDETVNYVEDWTDYYNGHRNSRTFVKFGEPEVASSKILGADVSLYFYNYGLSQIGVNDLDYDPETATDAVVWDDCAADNIYNDTYWEPTTSGTRAVVDLNDQDYLDKYAAHSDWYGVGFIKKGGMGNYLYIYGEEYSYYDYAPKLLVKYRDPYELKVEIKNVDPVMDTTDMVVTPTVVDEGDTVSVSGITYTDVGCDEHMYRVIVDLGPTEAPIIVKDWTDVEGGTLDFDFVAGDDDPDEGTDDSVDDITITIELKDDDYTPDLHYDSIMLVCTHYEYYYSYYDHYYYTPQKPWGVYRNLVSWDESTVTWANYPRSNAASTPEDTLPAHSHLTGGAYYGYFEDEWEITDIMRDWLDGTYPNYGLRMQSTTSGRDGFYLYSTDYSTYAPYLKVDFTEPALTDIDLELDSSTKDACLREGYYEYQNFGTYSYFVYAYVPYPGYIDYYGYYKEGAGVIEFNLDELGLPPETDLSGFDSVDFTLTISNVAPELDDTTYKFKTLGGEIVDAVPEGTEFLITDITFKDPAAGFPTEEFEYRVDMGDGSGYGPWSEAKAVTPGGYAVVPPEYEDADTPSYTNYYFGYPYTYYPSKRYMQWLDADDLPDDAKLITHIGWKPTWYEYYLAYEWTAYFGDLQIYLSHKTGGLSSSTFSSNYGFDRTLVYDGELEWYHPEDSEEFMFIELETPFVYDGQNNLVIDVLYSDFSWDSDYYYAVCLFSYDYNQQQMIYANSATATSGYGPYTYTYVYKFLFDDSFTEPYGIIPPIQNMYPDDMPTGTSSDVMSVDIQLRDDDGGLSTGALEITVENVDPAIMPGEILIDGAEPSADVLIVKDDYLSSYSVENVYEKALEPFFKYSDLIYSTDSGFTAANMANYKFVIYLMDYELWYRYNYMNMYQYYYDYFSDSEATELNDYLEDYGGKLWFVCPYAYGYNYAYMASPLPDPTYTSYFFDLFGVEYPTYQHYLYDYPVDMVGVNGWFADTETFSVAYPEPYFPYGYYATSFDLDGGTNELLHEDYATDLANMFVHYEDSSWGSKALISGFDLNQIGDKDDHVRIMEEVLAYFDIPEYVEVTIDEGQEIELRNFDIVDPAEGETTETFQMEVDWGDGEDTGLFDIEEGLNMEYSPSIVVPNANEDTPGNSANYYPFNPSYSYRRQQMLLQDSELGGRATTFNSISFRPDEYYYYLGYEWTVNYYNLKVYLNHLSSSSLDYYAYNNYGTDRTLVYDGTGDWFTWYHAANSEDWLEIPFDNADFDYDGSSNVVFEVSYQYGTYTSSYYYPVGRFDSQYNSGVITCRLATSQTSDYMSSYSYYGLVTKLGIEATPPTPTPEETYTHLYRDDPAVGDSYTLNLDVYDDDLGHGNFPIVVTVNNVNPTISPNTVLRPITVSESGSPNVPLPSIDFDDPATQYDIYDPNEVWTGVWDINNDGILEDPDVFVSVPQGAVSEIDDHSYGTVPEAMATVNDDFYGTITFYLFDDDMALDLSPSTSSTPDSVSTTITVYNTPPVASIEVYIPMEVRIRMTGRESHDTQVVITQVNPSNSNDVLRDEMTIERVPGKPKENPYKNGDPAEPMLVKVEPWRQLLVIVNLDGTADPNDPLHPNGYTHGSNQISVFLDFPKEDDYDPMEDDQSVSGHHWSVDVHYNANQDPTASHTFDASEVIDGKKAYLVGISYDDASDDAQFNWMVVSGSAPLPYTRITYYNDGSDPVVNGPFRDASPSAFSGTAPVTYYDVHEFVYSTGFGVQLYTVDDDWGVSNLATLIIP
jgi:hypothetical protein